MALDLPSIQKFQSSPRKGTNIGALFGAAIPGNTAPGLLQLVMLMGVMMAMVTRM